jgi:prolyl-tRNA editing enzyme YbaK/EbsC (Cys-tRNA(Pro) deacylase)
MVPENETEAIEERVQSALQALEIPHEVMPCDPELADTAAFCDHYRVSLANSANAIIVASKKEPKQYAACLVLATTKLDVNRTVRNLMGVKRLSFASAEESKALTGMMAGGVTLFGLPESLPIYIDRRVMDREYVVLGGGSRSSKIKVAPEELKRLPNTRIVAGLGLERPS